MPDEQASSMRVRVAAQSLGLSLLMAAIATLSILIFRGQFRALRWARMSAPAASAHAPSLLHDQALVRVEPEPDPVEEPPKKQLPPEPHRSARELFAEAARARERGDFADAIALSRQIEQFFPSSSEGITTHLSLGVIYLQLNQPNLALAELTIYRHIGDPEMMAEALWGQAQALRQLARPSDEREILQELLKSYPRSVYVAAAKDRLKALPGTEPQR